MSFLIRQAGHRPQVAGLQFIDEVAAPPSVGDPALVRIGLQVYLQDTSGNLWPLIPGADSAGVVTVAAAMSPYAVQPTDRFLLVNTSAGPVQVNLPATAVGVNPIQFVDSARSFGTNALTINGNGHNINGGATLVVSSVDACPIVFWGGTTWESSPNIAAPFNPHAPGAIGDVTPGSGAFSGLTAPALASSAANPLALSSGITPAAGASAFTFTSSTTQNAAGGGLIELSNNNGLGNVGNWLFGYSSGGQSDSLCDGVILIASGGIGDGDLVVYTGAKNTVAKSAASGNLLTIAGVAVGAASGGKVRVAKRGLVYVNAVAGTNGATLLVSSGATAGAVATGAAAIGAFVGRSLENVSATIAGKLLCDLILG